MDIEIDNIPLIKRVEDPQKRTIQEIRNVYNISTSERRMMIEHKIPGLDDSIFQDMGKEPLRISFDGVFLGEKAKENLQDLWSRFKQGKPVNFSSDITGIADVTKVLIEDLRIDDIGGSSNNYHYSIVLGEYREPRQPQAQPPPSQEEEAQEEVKKESEIDDIRGRVLDAEGKPAKDVTVKIKGDNGEWEVKTDEEGYYEVLDVPEGKYEVTVDAEGYEDVKGEVEVKKGGAK